QHVDELADGLAVVARGGEDRALHGTLAAAHLLLPSSRGTGLRLLGPVLGAALVATLDARGVELAAHDMVAHARQVLHTATTDEHDRVLLQVVAFAGDVGGDFEAVDETDTGDLAE